MLLAEIFHTTADPPIHAWEGRCREGFNPHSPLVIGAQEITASDDE
jgi:hypothetical protein